MKCNPWVGGSIGRRGFPMLGTGKRGLSTYVKDIFRNNEQGFFYDPNDLTTMYQDAAGTVPVTAAGQPVGLMLDKSKGLVLGEERVLNTSFETSDDWVLDANSNLSIMNGQAVFSSTPAYKAFRQTGRLTVGKWYKITIDVAEISLGSLFLPNLFDTVITTAGVKTYIAQAKFDYVFLMASALGATAKVNSVSVKELAGNHAYQTTSASRPILQQTPILGSELLPVAGSFDAGMAGWASHPSIGWAFEGGAAVSTVDVTTTSYLYPLPAVTSIGKPYTISMVIRSKGTQGSIGVSFSDGAQFTKSWKFTDIANGSVLTWSGIISGNVHLYIMTKDGWDGSIESVSIKEITGYRADQNFLAFDGTDDFLVTNNIDFTTTDKLALFAGVRKLTDSTPSTIFDFGVGGVSSSPNSFSLQCGGGSGTESYTFGSRGNGGASYAIIPKSIQPSFNAPHSSTIVTRSSVTGNLSTLRVNNSILRSNSANQGGGNYGNYPLYIGRRAGTSLPFNGHIYGLIVIGKLVSDNETIVIEKELAKRTGVTLNV